MAKQKTKAQLIEENKFLKRANIATVVGSNINTFIRSAMWVGIAYFAYLSIGALAGQSTSANIIVQLLSDIRVETLFSYAFGVSGIVYGLRERKLRQRTIEHLQPRARVLEGILDERRSSSRLTLSGETNPADRGDI